ncbi:GntR family transcriptional regulator [Lactiplantibacillus mudanjiangensis]|uniref:Transcription regulator [Lactobacillus plantarum JDM1] n=1 Tax=Lactiplantibacillus mudanjiangensis TaxID=1296538 RepID=A0A660DUE4_9LACO|nr:GntR family transcriptional regulator [Lactiplantibacillus mudanjiangensis]VDG21239.1 transcription regulator [Lactobacillus plantarum JDM1] [Lactiplantibacillus mudanjiangensis]VDG22813.1 transcription regulator [Lactobacillus plantarum JDM1] [Lactiplantibacillus mudanjiangensis]VDG26615.1 transcription regulator [Lactobacillus plantarum JDM1] [Lactiplantibacillus mudanjiangensis]VDG31849.1 transcription regulator [Lactobacillus plantarum JDM1] [Lactiplantibacillus mudanjiangensis]
MYHTIAQAIIKSIMADEYVTKLPTEKALMVRFDASRSTIRKAIDVVFRHGLLRRVQGSGYFIIKQPENSGTILNLSIGFDQAAMVEGGPLTSKIVTFDKILADERLANQGNIEVSTELHRVIRLRYLKDRLYSLEESYFPKAIVPFLSEDGVKHSIFAFLREAYDIYGSTTENYVHQVRLTATRAQLMNEPVGDKTLCLDGINYLANGSVFNFSQTYFVYPDLELYYHTENIDLQN